jgi:hypothetical protein
MTIYYTTVNSGTIEKVLQEGLQPVKPSWLPNTPAVITLKKTIEEVVEQLRSVLSSVPLNKKEIWLQQYKICLLAIEDIDDTIENIDCGIICRTTIPPHKIKILSTNLFLEYKL